MRHRKQWLAVWMALALVVVVAGCGPTPTPTPETTAFGPAFARDAALATVWTENTPLSELRWTEENLTPKDLVGSATIRYTSGAWQVTVVYPIVAPEATRYTVMIVNSVTALAWSGEVNAQGTVRAVTEASPGAPGNANMPNPASVYCEDQGGTLEIRTGADGGQVGICIFTDGSECDEWAFFRGECAPGAPGDTTPGANAPNPASVFCEEHGGASEIRTGADGGQVGICIFTDGSECDEWAYFRGECAPGESLAPEVNLDREATYAGVTFRYNADIATQAKGETAAAEELWEVVPAHTAFSFSGYALPATFHEARIRVYAVSDFPAGSGMANTAAALRTLLDGGQLPAVGGGFEGPGLPFLPPFNAGQLLRTQLAFVEFQNGRGLRFLTEYAQYYAPINNTDLFYTFQGLTADGRYYVAAIFPVSHPSLPPDASTIPGGNADAFANTYETYANDMALQLAGYGAAEFTPSLALLDALIASLQVTP